LLGSPEKRLKDFLKNRILVFDANIWIHGLLGTESISKLLLDLCVEGIIRVVVDSYCVAEVLRALFRLAEKKRLDPNTLQRNFWRILNADNVIKDFGLSISRSLIGYVIRKDEIRLIARILGLESKDVPYLLTAFKHSAIIITTDDRSLYAQKELIKKKLNIEIMSTRDLQK